MHLVNTNYFLLVLTSGIVFALICKLKESASGPNLKRDAGKSIMWNNV